MKQEGHGVLMRFLKEDLNQVWHPPGAQGTFATALVLALALPRRPGLWGDAPHTLISLGLAGIFPWCGFSLICLSCGSFGWLVTNGVSLEGTARDR